MAVLVYLVRLTLTGLVGESVTPSGPVHTVFTVTGTSTDGLNSTVQVKITELPAVMAEGMLVMLTVRDGTGEEKSSDRLEQDDYRLVNE